MIKYFFSAANFVSAKPSVDPLPRIKMSFFYYQYAQMSSYLHQILLFLSNLLPSDIEKLPRGSNPLPYPEYEYLNEPVQYF